MIDIKNRAISLLAPDGDWMWDDGNLIWCSENVIQPTEEEIQTKIAELKAAEPLRLLRIERDRLIQQTDWWVLPDRTATPAQLAYRQALRDLPANSTPELDENGNLTGVEWPVYSEEA